MRRRRLDEGSMVTFGGDEIASGWELIFDEGITAQ
jgi:hypothetical protein